MRKILLSFLALLAVAGSSFTQNLPSYVPANGLVGWWPFNGNANDESGNGNNGTVNGATLTTDRFGNVGKAYSFNGSTQNILLGDIAAMEGNAHSISVWVKINQFNPNYSDIVTKEVNVITQKQWVLQFNNQKVRNAVFTTNSEYTFNSQQSLLALNWFHIVKTWNGFESKTYINGVLDSTIPTIGSLVQANHNITVGGNSSFPDHYLNGKIDDIVFYNRALSQQEITTLYQGGNINANCPDLSGSLLQGLVGYWPFCGNANDESGNGNNGTVNGATLTADRFGNAGSAYSFDGTDDFGNVPYNPNFNMQKSTWSFWINKSTSAPANGNYILGYSDNEGHHISNITVGDSSYCQIVGSTWPGIQNGAGYIPNNSWHMISFTYDQTISQNNFSYYLDGLKIKTVTLLLPINFSTNSQLRFGVAANGLLFNPFTGSLDDIAIWNRALSQSEITQLYNQGICQQSITVTDTLLIHTGITSYNPVAYQNTLKVWPNPGNQEITIDAGNLSLMQGWKIKISNSLGQEVIPASLISQQQQTLDLTTWGGSGLYLLHLINPQGHITEVKKIVLAP